jgi:hypothetical protein
VVATQIPKPRYLNLDNLIPTFFLASSNLEDEISLRVVVCHDPGFYQILGEIFFVFVLLGMIEISQEFKTF